MANDIAKAMLRNLLLGKWAAEKLGLSGEAADVFGEAFARGDGDPLGQDVYGRLRKQFDEAGVSISDGAILGAIEELTTKSGNAMPSRTGGSGAGAEMMLKRKLVSR
ncbi:hypothetical protein GCM10007036_08000 [Alsobacter metallidurans]|uniref:DUF1476 domain-containing protein n=1 Tax=Alsobacter metallidurans TaxID=340221 RepID=A0A917MGH3_9HYPH|nr:ATPase inhibitor subunit zeta [Alsobacter metallidurans]GGH11127.1 hypothetical protein GCM10007036_08000 [Alsobacter metallidurans]